MSNIVGLKTKDGVNMGVLKIDNNSIKVFDAASGQFVPSVSQGTGTTVVQKKIYPSFTFPIPYDKNDDNLTLIVDISETPQFINQISYSQSSSSDTSNSSFSSDYSDFSSQENTYVRINMTNFKSQMKIISNGQFVQLGDNGVDKQCYGCLITFQLNQMMYPNFQFSKTYYARYSWMDSNGSISDWNGFMFSSDVTDFTPIDVKKETIIQPVIQNQISTGTMIDYLDGQIQKFSMINDVNLSIYSIINIPYGKFITIIISLYNSSTLTLQDQNGKIQYNENGQYMIKVYNYGNNMMISEKTVSQFQDKGDGSLTVYITGGKTYNKNDTDTNAFTIDDGQTWFESGTKLTLAAGQYVVKFRQLENYIQPAPENVTIKSGKQQTVTGNYLLDGVLTGFVKINFTDNFGQWSNDNGTTWHNSGQQVQLPVGNAIIKFKDDNDYFTPSPITVQITQDNISTHTITYTKAARLKINLNKSSGAWSINNGSNWYTSGTTLKLNVQSYQVVFKDLFGFLTPTSKTYSLTFATTTQDTVTYETQPASVISSQLTEYTYNSQPYGIATIYAAPNASGNGTLNSPCSLYSALSKASKYSQGSVITNTNPIKIYCQGGTYTWNTTWYPAGHRNIQVYGGFDSSFNWNTRQPISNPTIINGNGTSQKFLYNTSFAHVTIDGFKFINFYSQLWWCFSYSYHTGYTGTWQKFFVRNCVIENCHGTSSYLLYGSCLQNTLVKNCTFKQGLLYTKQCISDCVFLNCYSNSNSYSSIYGFYLLGNKTNQSVTNTKFLNCYVGNNVYYNSNPAFIKASGTSFSGCIFANCYVGSAPKKAYFFYGSVNLTQCKILNCYLAAPQACYFFYGQSYLYNVSVLNCSAGTSYGGTKYFFSSTSYVYNSQFVNCGVTGTYMGYCYAYNTNFIKCVGTFYQSHIYNCFVYQTLNSFTVYNNCYITNNPFGYVNSYGLNSIGFVPTYTITNYNYIPTFTNYFGNWVVVSGSPLYVNGQYIGCYNNAGMIIYQ